MSTLTTDDALAPYAMTAAASRGRAHPEPDHAYRPPYQRDRERIIHCAAFRRLMGKTQVVVAGTSDHPRTRLTHSLEVAQIARAVARALRLHEDLTEAIALSHDLGHPPFGHAGERALNECLADVGGYEHNRQALRIVEDLEERYPDFPGLNLTWEVREAMAQHSPRADDPAVAAYRAVGGPLLEAQVVDAADSLAYDTHDLEDALGVGLITHDDLCDVGFWQQGVTRVYDLYGDVPPDRLRHVVVRHLIDWQVTDLLADTRRRLETHRVRALADVRRCREPLVGHGPVVRGLKAELEAFLLERVYRHARVLQPATKGRRFVTRLFEEFSRVPEMMPPRYLRRCRGGAPAARVAGDYLGGMTDRYAQREYVRLFQPTGDH